VLLVQGPFGCGKTHTLSALVRQLCTELSTAGSKERILIAGYTNACVDGLLCALLDAGFDDFARYGSLRRIAPRILPHAVGSRAGGGASKADDDERDLRAALEGARTASERATVTAELEAVKAGRSAARMRRLAACRVVAVTTASCTQERLHGQKFACVLLDEASQLTEPAALLPLVRFGARCCVLVGDPEQLSPLLVNLDADCDLGRPLFVRLASVGHSPTLLRTQYRCHPAISAVPNLQFYGGRLLDGVTAAQRAPLLPSLPPLVFLDVDHRSPAIGGNDAEATLTQRVVRMLCGAGVPPSDIACITFLRDHVSRTHQSVNRSTNYGEQGLLCSTIDAFQGQERDVIVLSFAGLQPQFASAQRINVALRRARRHLICIGSSTGALRGQAWFAALLAAARRRPRAYSRITDLRDALPRFDDAPALPLPPPAEEMDIICDSPPRGAAGGSSEDAKACARLSLASVGAARASDEDVDDSPLDAADAADAEPFMCSVPAEAAFAAAAFSGADLWAGYKAFHVLQYATVKPATAERAAFFATKFGASRSVTCGTRLCSRALLTRRHRPARAVPQRRPPALAAAAVHAPAHAGRGVCGQALRGRARGAPVRAAGCSRGRGHVAAAAPRVRVARAARRGGGGCRRRRARCARQPRAGRCCARADARGRGRCGTDGDGLLVLIGVE
jgi:hypothetical protein